MLVANCEVTRDLCLHAQGAACRPGCPGLQVDLSRPLREGDPGRGCDLR